MDARTMFKREYDGARNFMTPDLVTYGKRGALVYEISSGEFGGHTIYGVTVLRENEDGTITREHDMSHMCETLEEAKVYAHNLRDEQTEGAEPCNARS